MTRSSADGDVVWRLVDVVAKHLTLAVPNRVFIDIACGDELAAVRTLLRAVAASGYVLSPQLSHQVKRWLVGYRHAGIDDELRDLVKQVESPRCR